MKSLSATLLLLALLAFQSNSQDLYYPTNPQLNLQQQQQSTIITQGPIPVSTSQNNILWAYDHSEQQAPLNFTPLQVALPLNSASNIPVATTSTEAHQTTAYTNPTNPNQVLIQTTSVQQNPETGQLQTVNSVSTTDLFNSQTALSVIMLAVGIITLN